MTIATKYDPNQPRDPGGEGGGRWVKIVGAADGSGEDAAAPTPLKERVRNKIKEKWADEEFRGKVVGVGLVGLIATMYALGIYRQAKWHNKIFGEDGRGPNEQAFWDDYFSGNSGSTSAGGGWVEADPNKTPDEDTVFSAWADHLLGFIDADEASATADFIEEQGGIGDWTGEETDSWGFSADEEKDLGPQGMAGGFFGHGKKVNLKTELSLFDRINSVDDALDTLVKGVFGDKAKPSTRRAERKAQHNAAIQLTVRRLRSMGTSNKYAPKTTHGSADWVREEVARVLRVHNPDPFVFVKDVFPTNVIVEFEEAAASKSTGERQIYSYSYEVDGDTVIVGHGSPVEPDYVVKMREKFTPEPVGKRDLSNRPIVKKDEDTHLVYAAVLVPGETDKNGERPLSEDEVTKYAHGYMKNFRYMDTNHDFQVGAGVPVESWVTKDVMPIEINGVTKSLRKGSWVIGSEPDSETWAAIESGEITGYSITGIPQKTLEMATKSDDVAFKTLLLEDLENPVVGIVSYVKNPAVKDAVFFAKKEEATKAERVSFWEKIGLVRSSKDDDSAEIEEEAVAKGEGMEITLDSLTSAMKGAFSEALVEKGLAQAEPAEKSDTEQILGAIQGLAEAIGGTANKEEDSGESGTAHKEQSGRGSEDHGSAEQGEGAAAESGTAGRSGSDKEGLGDYAIKEGDSPEVVAMKQELQAKDELLDKAHTALKRNGTGSRVIADAADANETPSTTSDATTLAGLGGSEKIERDAYGRRIR